MSKTIPGISEETHKKFNLFKIKMGAKNADEALLKLLESVELKEGVVA